MLVLRTMEVPIDPEILVARALQAAAVPAFDMMTMPPAEARALLNQAAAVFNDGLPDMARVEDHRVDGPGGPVRLRVYTPQDVSAQGGIFYLHGGGWFACDVDTHDRMLRLLAQQSGAVLFSADYRLSPEHPFPAPLDDAAAAWDWIEHHAAEHDVDPARIAFAGDSAGANLALSLAIRLRDAGWTMPLGCALLYGCFAPALDTDSARTFGAGGYGLTAERMAWYWRNYLGAAQDVPPVGATPLYADLAGLPPIFLGIAEADTVADDSRLLAEKLRAAGVPVELLLWPGAVHGFLQMTRDVALARRAVGDVAEVIANWVG
uniref:alpha/beta hydrolase n=1 Tax=Sphingomonas bacterium TaxID=1895847 RepID=UPI002628A29C|nr:alpha/beta hydrolase [Sphingomonas bacterium]